MSVGTKATTKKNVTIYIPPQTAEEMKLAAYNMGVSISGLIAMMVNLYVRDCHLMMPDEVLRRYSGLQTANGYSERSPDG